MQKKATGKKLKRANKKLLRAVLEPRMDGALQAIAEACEAGADPNSICPECSTSSGPVQAGSTLLTQAIQDWASNAVKALLECGADPNLADQNGWTPWMASTLVDESKQDKIQDTLLQYGSDKKGEHIGQLASAIADGDVDRVTTLIQSDKDLEFLSTFRVDLMGHQIGNGNPSMLEFLLERNMQPSSTNLINAVRWDNLAAVDLLLRYGMAPEEPDKSETPLMTAASMGNLQIVKRLVESGADVNRFADDKGEWTPAFHAKKAGKTDVAEWLTARMNDQTIKSQEKLAATRDQKYKLLYEQATASESRSTDDIVRVLTEWDAKYQITVTGAEGDSLRLEFSSLPENLKRFYAEIEDLCPDASDSKDELLKELQENKKLFLWWD